MSAPEPRRPRSRGAGPVEAATRRAALARDEGLRRISSVTRWVLAGVVGLSGALALIAADAFHGHTTATGAVSSESSGAGVTTTTPGSLQQPSQVPTVTQAPPVVVSGGS